MKAFWTTLEYGARLLGALLMVVGIATSLCGGCAYLVGEAMEEPLPFGPGEWVLLIGPLGLGMLLYVLSGTCKGLANDA